MEIHITIKIERKHAFLLAGILLLIAILNLSKDSLAVVTTGVYHTLDEIYTKVGAQYVPLATTTGKINASLIEGKVANASQADYALNADKLDGKDASAFASATHTHNLNSLQGVLQPSKGGTGITSCSNGQVLKWNNGRWICGTDNTGSGGISSCSSCDSRFVNTAGDSMTRDLNMRDNDILDVNTIQANTLEDPEDSLLTISDHLEMLGNINMRGNDIIDADVVQARTLLDPVDNQLDVKDNLNVNGNQIINLRRINNNGGELEINGYLDVGGYSFGYPQKGDIYAKALLSRYVGVVRADGVPLLVFGSSPAIISNPFNDNPALSLGGDLNMGGNNIKNCGTSDCGDYIFRNQKTGKIAWILREGENNELEFYNSRGEKVMELDQEGNLKIKGTIQENWDFNE